MICQDSVNVGFSSIHPWSMNQTWRYKPRVILISSFKASLCRWWAVVWVHYHADNYAYIYVYMFHIFNYIYVFIVFHCILHFLGPDGGTIEKGNDEILDVQLGVWKCFPKLVRCFSIFWTLGVLGSPEIASFIGTCAPPRRKASCDIAMKPLPSLAQHGGSTLRLASRRLFMGRARHELVLSELGITWSTNVLIKDSNCWSNGACCFIMFHPTVH